MIWMCSYCFENLTWLHSGKYRFLKSYHSILPGKIASLTLKSNSSILSTENTPVASNILNMLFTPEVKQKNKLIRSICTWLAINTNSIIKAISYYVYTHETQFRLSNIINYRFPKNITLVNRYM